MIRFDEQGYEVIEDTVPRYIHSFSKGHFNGGYLHISDESAPVITDACRDQIVRYMFNRPRNLPGLGATPQHRYFQDLTTEDIERIGNDGKRSYYA